MSSQLKILALLLIAACLVMLFTASEFFQERYNSQDHTTVSPNKFLPMTFAHADHAKQQCAGCHHNYVDDTGQGLCLDCHRTEPTIAFKFKDQFHDLCMGCHTDQRLDGHDTGPLRSCSACHTADDRP